MIREFQVPIIGRQAQCRASGAVLMVTVTCLCAPANLPMLIRGHDLMVWCDHCGEQYGIMTCAFDRGAGDVAPRMDIGLVARTLGS